MPVIRLLYQSYVEKRSSLFVTRHYAGLMVNCHAGELRADWGVRVA
ncbi:hypothetical protein [Aneurinibacillus terranovensis]